jgi:predicted alpha/beta superfamily hydrolase
MNRQMLLSALLAIAVGPASAQAVLKVSRVPANTPAPDTLYVAGSFNGWNARSSDFALHRNADGSYQISLPAGLGPVEYKFTRGKWDKVEVDAHGQLVANRKADAGVAGEVSHEILAWNDLSAVAQAPVRHTTTPQVRVLSEAFQMPQLGRSRRVLVYLPASYARQPKRRYPVLYVHDGQNVFDAATSFSGEWGIDETLDRLQANGQDPAGSIVVAIDNGGRYRGDEYIPWRNAGLKMGGQGGAYVDFLAQTLKPYVDAHYRTRTDAAHTGVAGSSLGGLISVYAALKYPLVFGRVGAFSPAFWVCNDSLTAFYKTHPAAPTTKFYFVCGPKESETMLPLTVSWRNTLRAVGGVPAANLRLTTPADGEHKEWFWQREFPAAYRWLFGLSPQPAATKSKPQHK